MGFVIRQTTTGKVLTHSAVRSWWFYSPADRNPLVFSGIGQAKATITKAIKDANGWRLLDMKEELLVLCLELEIVEVTETYSVSYGDVVFSQLFRANKI